MSCLDLMIEEHKLIKRMLVVIRKYCYWILKDQPVDYRDFYKMIDFVRNYADSHHHGKEELLLFDKMVDELGLTAEKLVKHGMLVEHDLGRLHMRELESALQRFLDGDDEARLDIIANAISYTHLLFRHIDKEDRVVFEYAKKNLSPQTMQVLNQQCEAFENKAQENAVQDHYLKLLQSLESKVI